MNGKMESFVALRYMRGKRKIGFVSWITYISAAGVCLGSFVLVVALSIANGFEAEVRDRIVGTLAHGKISQDFSIQIREHEALRNIILDRPQVLAASPYITGKGGIEYRNMQEGVMINGIDPKLETTVTDVHNAIIDGSFDLDSMVSSRSPSAAEFIRICDSVLSADIRDSIVYARSKNPLHGGAFKSVEIDRLVDSLVRARLGDHAFASRLMDSVVEARTRKFPGILVGSGLAGRMHLRLGSEVLLYSLPVQDDMQDIQPKIARFTVSGIFETGMYEYDLNLVYITIASAQHMLNMDGVEGIQIKTTDLYKAGEIVGDIQDHLNATLAGSYRAEDWQSQNRSLFEWMKLERYVIFIVISLIMVVAAFNIISSLIMMILEKRREIGILMSMGATSGSIMRVFMLNGVIVGFIGSTIGITLGAALCYTQIRWRMIPIPGDLYFINTLPMELRWLDVAAIYVAANLICWFATVYPAWKASSLLPAESIRYE